MVERTFRRALRVAALAAILAAPAPAPRASLYDNGPAIDIARLSGPVEIDGDLSDPAWADATRIDTWWETNPGDNVEPAVRNLAWAAFDDTHLYVAFEFADERPDRIRAPLGDRDNVPSYTDYGGVILDPRGDGKTAQMFLANARGIQYDAITSDATGEDSSPDFFWESAGRVANGGWSLEIRIPYSSIRYTDPNPAHWGILLYRNHPRDYRRQYFSSRLPRDRNCFICNVRDLRGMADLPTGGRWVVAPYATAARTEQPVSGLGSALDVGSTEYEGGADVKWLPNPDTVLDLTVNPDFSQIESDTAQITANERFALSLPETRPFFLESVDLLSTPFRAVYTRTFSSPQWGARATGGGEKTKYTVLVGEDRGGGSVVLPGPQGSDFAPQDFDSLVAIGRVRRELGSSFASFLYTGREIDGGGSNRVFGPDFEWRPTESDSVTGQLLWSETRTPDRPDLAAEWDGRSLAGHAAKIWWQRGTATWDYFLFLQDVDEEFRADNGFVPRVGFREGLWEVGRTFRSEDAAIRRLRVFAFGSYAQDSEGEMLHREVVPGAGFDGPWNSFVRLEVRINDERADDTLYRRYQLRPFVDVRPGRRFQRLYVEGTYGDEIDFANGREGEGGTALVQTTVAPSDHLSLSLLLTRRWLDVDDPLVGAGRLFTSDVARLRGVYTFSARSWLRLIAQWVETRRDPTLYTFAVDRRDAGLAGSLVFAYKLNWQTVLYLGVADDRQLDVPTDTLEPASRQAFFKMSYAFRG